MVGCHQSAFFLLLALAAAEAGHFQGHKRRLFGIQRPQKILTPLPRTPVPEQWHWSNVSGVNYLTQAKNQHIPQYCGSCWAQAATSSMSDRIKIARKAAWPDINIAPQVLISCGPNDGCHGGDSGEANKWIAEHGITDETCSIYQARGHDNGLPCSKLEVCETCDPNEGCSMPKRYLRYTIEEYADVEGDNKGEQEQNMMAEIFHRGPITCGIAVSNALLNYTGGVFVDKTGLTSLDHDISVVGYGVDKETGLKYWMIRNSWGTYWGEQGFFRLVRGINNLGIESGSCVWATPKDTWSDVHFPSTYLEGLKLNQDPVSPAEPFLNRLWNVVEDFVRYASEDKPTKKPCRVNQLSYENGPVITSPLPQETIMTDDLPKSWDWRNISGRNYLSWTVNQHIPQYCGSCWAQGTLSAIADRFNIIHKDRFPTLALSPQVIINCRAGGSCFGGNPGAVYEFMHKIGVPDMTCQIYEAKNNGPVEDCSKPNKYICRDCTWPPPKPGQKANCWAKEKFTRYYVNEYGPVSGAENMKKEIYARGPIGCGIDVTAKFEAYNGGIYKQWRLHPFINHEISVVGWGYDEETEQEYWIGRNSWGTYWGEYGFFRIQMHKDNLGIENDCQWAVPREIPLE